MTKKEYMEQLPDKSIDAKKVEEIEAIYCTKLPEIVKKIVSNANESIFFDDDDRILSYKEIADAQVDLHVNFKSKGLIPLADCGENDFIVYHFNDGSWSKFNIIDETVFKKRNALDELLK